MAASFKHLNSIDDKTKLSVFGYILQLQKELLLDNIPPLISYLCLAYYHNGQYFETAGDGLKINEQYLIYEDHEEDNWKTGYGIECISQGRHEWKIKVLEFAFDIMIGVSSDTKHCDNSFIKKRNTHSYAYSAAGYKNDKVTDSYYGDKFVSDDIIGVHLDIEDGSVSFSKNGKNMGVAFKDVPSDKTWRLAVGLSDHHDQVKIMSYTNIDGLW